MNNILSLSPADQRLACIQVEDRMGLRAASVEKDFWVCWTLRELTRLPEVGAAITFKGGTSLSKVWGHIQRFSEDIDLVIDKEILGFGGENAPEKGRSASQRNKRLAGLRKACRHMVQEVVQPTFAQRIEAVLGEASWVLEVDPDVRDGQCLLFHYPTVFAGNEGGYVRPVVKIEFGARSQIWPAEQGSVQPYLATAAPLLAQGATFEIQTLKARRTFWEKAALLHEENCDSSRKAIGLRLSRHYYDLWALIEAGIGEEALADGLLFQDVVAHRQCFFPRTGVDYATMQPGSLRIGPSPAHLPTWKRDYEEMRVAMFYNESPDFDEILRVVNEFQDLFNARQSSGHS